MIEFIQVYQGPIIVTGMHNAFYTGMCDAGERE